MTVTTSGSTREGSENHLEGKGTWISAMPLDALGLAIVYIKNVNQTINQPIKSYPVDESNLLLFNCSSLDNIYGLLTKRAVKITGYWPRFCFACLWTKTESRSINTQKRTTPASSHTD